MGMNFRSCCHKCKEQIFHYRGNENKSMPAFYKRHYECMRENAFNLETLEDQIQESIWMRDPDSYDEVSILFEITGRSEFIATGNPYKSN
jgi:hypothetical protein